MPKLQDGGSAPAAKPFHPAYCRLESAGLAITRLKVAG